MDNLCFLGFDCLVGSNLIGGPSRLCVKLMQLADFGGDRVNSLCGHGFLGCLVVGAWWIALVHTFIPFDRRLMIKSSLFQIFFACIQFGRLSQ